MPGFEPDEVSNDRTGIIMGSGGASTRAIVEAADTTRTKGPKRVGPFAVPKAMSSTASATLATWFKIKGVNYSISSACATSNHCIGNAYETIQLGKQDVIFAGGCEELDWTLSVLFDGMGAMSTHFNDRPAVASRAYDKDRDGFVIAGGAGVVVLEELEHAKARGARIYGEIVGYGATSDGFDMVAPSGEGAARCMKMALADGRRADRLHQPARHLDADRRPQGDRGDPRGRSATRCPPISATKSLTGHSLGATGVQEAIYSPADDEQRLHRQVGQYRRARPGLRRHADRPRADRRRRAQHGRSPIPSASAAPTPRWSSSAMRADEPPGNGTGGSERHDSGPDEGQARPRDGRRQRPFDRLGHRPRLAAAGRRARLHLPGRRRSTSASGRSPHRSAPTS